MNFEMKNVHGVQIYYSDNGKFSILYNDIENKYYIRILDNGQWYCPNWIVDEFNWMSNDISYIEAFLNKLDMTTTKDSIKIIETELHSEFKNVMNIFRFEQSAGSYIFDCYTSEFNTVDNDKLYVSCIYHLLDDALSISIKSNKSIEHSRYFYSVDKLIIELENLISKYWISDVIAQISLLPSNTEYSIHSSTNMLGSFYISCAKSARDISKGLVRVKSSNVWGYNIDIKDRHDKFGNVVVQFKDKDGGPGDVYMLYDVPITLYRRWVSAPSKGHFYYLYLRNNFKYSKLTGDKKGKLRNAIN